MLQWFIRSRGSIALSMTVALLFLTVAPPSFAVRVSAAANADHVVISQVYAGGKDNASNASVYTHDYIELYNPTDVPVSLDGYSIQYVPVGYATGDWNVIAFGANKTIPAHGYYLIRGNQGAGMVGDSSKPVNDPDITASDSFPHLNKNGGTIALVDHSIPLASAISGGDGIVDLVGFGKASAGPAAYENAGGTGRWPADLSYKKFLVRQGVSDTGAVVSPGVSTSTGYGNGFDTNSNSDDFVVLDAADGGKIAPRNSQSSPEPFIRGTVDASNDTIAMSGARSIDPSNDSFAIRLSGVTGAVYSGDVTGAVRVTPTIPGLTATATGDGDANAITVTFGGTATEDIASDVPLKVVVTSAALRTGGNLYGDSLEIAGATLLSALALPPTAAPSLTVSSGDAFGANTTQTTIFVDDATDATNKLVYKNVGSAPITVPNVGDVLDGYADLPADKRVTATNGEYVAVAEVSVGTGAVVKFGQAKAVVEQDRPDRIGVTKIGSFQAGQSSDSGGIAEIVAYNPANKRFYSVNGASNPPKLDIVDIHSDGTTTLRKSVRIKEDLLARNVPGFEYGDFTSVNVNTANERIYLAIQAEDYSADGIILALTYEGEFVAKYDAGVQPDMVTSTKDGKYVLTANEGEPRLKDADGTSHPNGDPKGSVTIVDTATGASTAVEFTDTSVIDDDVHIRAVSTDGVITAAPILTARGTKAQAAYDFEPEYIAISGNKAYVSLQENNAIATIDISGKSVISVKSLGYKDFSLPNNALDLVNDGTIRLENVPYFGMYMPDGIDAYSLGGKTYLFTANEGEATADWPGFTNNGKIGGSSRYKSVEINTDKLDQGNYLSGGRSFSIYDADTMAQVYDSGNDFEKITANRVTNNFNASNSSTSMDNRSAKKGPEPEYVKVGKVGSKALAFIGLERVGGVMTYDVTNPNAPVFLNYTNTRDFTKGLDTDTGPEGVEFISASDSPTGLPLVLVANEVGGTIAVLQLNVAKLTLDQTAISLKVGGAAKKLNATVTPAATVTWSSSNASVATVDANGNVSAVAAGTATIKATSADGYAVAEAAVTVAPADSAGGGGYVPPVTPPTGGTNAPVASTQGGRTTVKTEVDAKTDASGHATADVTADMIDAALQAMAGHADTVLEFHATVDAGASDATIHVPAASFKQIASSTAEAVAVDAGIGRLVFDGKTLDTIAGAAGSGDISFAIAKTSAPAGAPAAIGDRPVFDFTVMAGSNRVSDFAGGTVTVSVPYTPKAGEDANAIVVYYIADNGDIVTVPNGTYDKATGKASFKVTHFSKYAVGYNPVAFEDTGASFAKDSITFLAARNIIKGVNAAAFSPSANVTRADFTLILARVAGADLTAYGGSGFDDVPEASYYAAAVDWASKTGIVTGVSQGKFAPTASITREQLATMIVRLAKALNVTLPANEAAAAFADEASIQPYALEAAKAVQRAGIVNGKTRANAQGSFFAPTDLATREETAKMLAIFMQGIMK